MIEHRILVVDDEWLVAEEHRTILEDAGYSVVGPAPSVRRALKLIETEVIAAAVLDVQLFGETCVPLLAHLDERNIPFLFVSGYSVADVPEDVRVGRMLAKPVSAPMLVGAVAELLAKE